MKKLITFVVLLFVLVGCQNANDQGAMDNNNMRDGNVEPTRYDNNSNLGQDMMDRNNSMQRDADRNQNNNYDVSEEAAERIADQVDGIDNAYVLTTENNAYVGAHLNLDNNDTNNNNTNNNNTNNNGNNNNMNNNNDAGEDISDDMKSEIADIVRSVDNDIDNVYVTSNPDFLDLTDRYVNDVNEGRPVEGFFDQMGNMIERIFPNNR